MITETYHFRNHPLHEPKTGPMQVFQDVSPIYLKVNFLQWCEIGIAEIGSSRKAEIEAIRLVKSEFPGLIDAVYFIATTFREDITDEEMKKSIRRYIEHYYNKEAKKEDILPAPNFCKAFFQKISLDSINSLLFILMELAFVHSSKYEYHVNPPNILDFFERYTAIAITGHNWKKMSKDYRKA